MSLVCDNPDWEAVKEGFGDEELTFWDIPDPVSHFFGLDADKDEPMELNRLVDDYHRVNEQFQKLCELMPHKKEKYLTELTEAIETIERKVKKLLGNKVRFYPNK